MYFMLISSTTGLSLLVLQTGSGKTHTMEGPTTDPGVNARALAELFRLVDERQDSETIIISASLLEIYNESIRDLLVCV